MPHLLALALVAAQAAHSPWSADTRLHEAQSPRWIVALAPAVDAARVAAMDRSEPLAARLEAAGLRVVARLDDGLALSEASARGAGRKNPAPWPWAFDPARIVLVEAVPGADARAWVTLLESDPAIAWFEPDRLREPCVWATRELSRDVITRATDAAFPNDPLWRDGRQWGLRGPGADAPPDATRGDVRASEAWRSCVGADSVRLALCDTGVDPAHPDLAGQLADGGPRLVDGLDVTTAGAPFADSLAHGTMVAGVMAARTNDGAHFDSLGIAGVCGGDGAATSGCRVIPVKITRGSYGGASSFAIARGILHAASRGARAINLSFAATGPSRTERLALLEALARGAVVVCAAGNNGVRDAGAAMWPAAHAADGLCVQVGACDPSGAPCAFSSHGPGLDVLAPGLDVWTTYLTYPSAYGARFPGYLAGSGTSFAAPFATGTIGLLAAARPGLAPEDFQHVLRLSARDAGAPGPDSLTGFGLLDAAAALELAGARTAIAHFEVAPVAEAVVADTLVVAERGIALLDSLGRRARAERWTLRARVAMPDSFADRAQAWVRVSGTMTLRDAWSAPYLSPWAEVRATGARTIEVEGTLFRIVDARADRIVPPDDPARWIPAPPERARVALTLMGPRRAPVETPAAAPVPGHALRATPNPTRGAIAIVGPPGTPVRVLDVAGRVVAHLVLDARDGRARWDGRDPGGRAAPPGLYWVVGAGVAPARFVRLR